MAKKTKPIEQMTISELLVLESQLKAQIAEEERAKRAYQRRMSCGPSLVMYAGEGDAEQVTTRLDAGAPINARSTLDFTPLMEASRRGRNEVVQLLVARGADLEYLSDAGNTALMLARSAPTTKILLDAGAQIDVQNNSGQTALHISARANDSDRIKLLLERGANPEVVDRRGQFAEELAQGEAKDILTEERVSRERALIRGELTNQDEPVQRRRTM
jgi:ankyrin repeat protein